MKVEKGKVVFIHYTVKNSHGDIIDTSIGIDPLGYVHGDGTLIRGLEMALEGQQKGDKLKIDIEPSDAYGEYSEALIKTAPLAEFEDVALDVGEDIEIEIDTDQGVESAFATVLKIENDNVVFDLNHPLAGQPLMVDVEVLNVRAQTPEEADTGHIMDQPIPESL